MMPTTGGCAAGAQTLEERARHLALATVLPDPAIAEVLEEAASALLGRGALDDALALAEHALRLTPPESLEPAIAYGTACEYFDFPLAHPLPDAIEAMVQLGQLERATGLADAMVAWGELHGRPWPKALGRRSRALILASQGDVVGAGAAIVAALDAHGELRMPFELSARWWPRPDRPACRPPARGPGDVLSRTRHC